MRRTIMHVGCFLAATAAAATTNCRCKQTITRDVAVIGGGASGAHAAVWLRDNGQSVVVVEKASQLVSTSSPASFPFCRFSADEYP
jgi:heterodisulfide reductase subunit A-like polyferredoxin